ncbi:MAG: tRNA (adenosine(37)-N6)-threonylcarbamoyltransferase complex ATPase subunit type 1 TsaE [Candidatus Falkowbacteria bacterium]|nr:tRNA (adenosine(37)-N6)-threonylcarbamoyltransferase complex ATPase subunit type 1 TsaE [Candidatus Falkowbacteria bacterium]
MKKTITKNETETFNLGQKLGEKCRGGEVFALIGELGAGKTKLLQGLAQGLGVKAKVNSPTFNIMKVYPIKRADANRKLKIFCHIDAYRLKSAQDLISLGVEEFFNSPDTVTAIEWGEKVKEIWPKKATVIKIKMLGKNTRSMSII